ncbi:MAG: HEAT repeat domain-containing protein [Phormidesmis sp. RL_2_1]|nr:HEAT repeat domain-containing protein [Phormidesmis sp. RL_2_1]
MNISEIKTLLASEDPQQRLRGLVALKDHNSESAVPLLIAQRQDEAFLVRSFVAMGLGRKRNDAAYKALLEMLPTESDMNVQAEIANSLGLYGKVSVARLVSLFFENHHWLVRRSVLAIMPELDSPEPLLTIALEALADKDETIVQAGIATLGMLAETHNASVAIAALLPLVTDENWRSRMAVAYALKPFSAQRIDVGLATRAQTALVTLRQDTHHQVVAAALEALLPA